MNHPDYAAAKAYAHHRLATELPAELMYHSLTHTMMDVLPAAMRLADMSGINGEQKALLEIAAVFHDIGYIEQREEHEATSVRIARQVLPQFGFNPYQINLIADTIMATRLPQTPQTLLGEIMADADLDVLGREDFFLTGIHLRQEMTDNGQSLSDAQWYQLQLDFQQSHHYFTKAAQQLRQAGKERNIAALKKRLILIQQQAEKNSHGQSQ